MDLNYKPGHGIS